MIDRRTYLATAAALVAPQSLARAAQAAVAQAAPTNADLDFAIVREGEVIGYHRFAFRRDADRMRVEIDVNAQVRRLGIALYRFTHRCVETWLNGRLIALESMTYDDGTNHTLSVQQENGALLARSGGNAIRHPADAIPTNLWHRGAVERRALLHSLKGTAVPITVQDLGTRQVLVRGTSAATRGWFIDGQPDYQRWEWFDPAGQLVFVRMYGSDSSQVEYHLR